MFPDGEVVPGLYTTISAVRIFFKSQIMKEEDITIDIKSTNPGFVALSNAPRKNRFAAMPAKFLHAAVIINTQPHATIVDEMNLPIGKCCRRKPIGNWKTR
jgi:hypothetical protein